MENSQKQITKLGVFSLAMITAGSVDSIRNLPTTALFGSSLIFFFLLGAILFLFPCALVSAELASTSKSRGGIYAWVKDAFGETAGFFAVWCQWIENVIWYPTILSFVAGTIAYLISPGLIANPLFLTVVILVSFWSITIINLFGMKSSAFFANICAVFGLLVPMTLIIALGVVWVVQGNPLHISFGSQHIVPSTAQGNLWVSLTGIILSFCGMEIAAVHSSEVSNPQKSYPRAMLISTLIILSTLMCGSLAIAIVLPGHEISLVAGIMQAFHSFFSAYQMQWVLPVLAIMLILGGMGGVNNWVIAPTRGLHLALQGAKAPAWILRCNYYGAPHVLLVSQACIVTLVTLVFLFLPSVNASYWFLTALASELYMMMYLIMFVSAIRLRYKKVERGEGFIIPGRNWGIWLVAGAGIIGACLTFGIGFIPPQNFHFRSVWHYEFLLICGLVLTNIIPFSLYLLMRRKTEAIAFTT